MEGLKVEWRRTDSETLVHLYEDGESRPEAQQQDYHDRAHFFTDEIQHGNFSLRLDNLKSGDKGEYTCKVYSQQDSLFSTKITLKKGLIVKCTSAPPVVPFGASVVLPCYCYKHLRSEGLKVEWRRTDSETLVHLYEDGESRPEAQQQDYHDRTHLFTDEIQHGNFSLRLDNLRVEDEGEYTCNIYRKQTPVFSAKTSLELSLLDSFLCLHLYLVFCPNVIMFFAFVFWGVSEGSLNETVSCCALYFLRPLMLLWAAPYINDFTDKFQTWTLKYSYVAEYVVLSLVIYSVLFASAWEKLLNYSVLNQFVIILLFAIAFLCCFCRIIYFLVTEIGKKSGRIIEIFDLLTDMTSDILPTLQFILLFFTFGTARGGFIVVILPALLMLTNDRWFYRCRRVGCSRSVIRTLMLIFILVINAVMIGLYIVTLENKTDPIGWGCVMVFLQIFWTVMRFTDVTYIYLRFDQDFRRIVPVYLFGSVCVVLLTSIALITEMILKTVNGDRKVGDLRSIVFPFECLFAASVLISGFFQSQIAKCLKSCQGTVRSKRMPVSRSQQNQNTAETQEMSPLKTEDQEEIQT
ncbi:uncharacterized protein LOC127509339 [Ctenopharyngodon idella]|uniref:uncharacterized protein LOC127509339 n=1 Tax=Ctenopharyngodon idella TaxID=7959 RepID=UPI002230A5BD|nr:uncharacterized protein LOC127509339 [Ctenopharyngodon idella]